MRFVTAFGSKDVMQSLQSCFRQSKVCQIGRGCEIIAILGSFAELETRLLWSKFPTSDARQGWRSSRPFSLT